MKRIACVSIGSDVPVYRRGHVAAAQNEPWTFGRLLQWTTGYLREHGSESARLDAEVLLAHAAGCERIALYTRFNEQPADSVRDRFRDLVRRRGDGAPVAYLVGHKEFFSLDFEVGPGVLIPRPDSEFVVLEFLGVAKDQPAVSVVDVGTGSGNLAIAAAVRHPGATVRAVDRSPVALEIARRNAAKHGVADRVEFLEGNLLDPIPPDAPVDCILSNPPYIPTAEIPNLPVGVRDYEPHLALDGGPTGLEAVSQIVAQAPARLKTGGYLIVEIGSAQADAVQRLVQAQPLLELLPTSKDYAGHDRVVRARKVG